MTDETGCDTDFHDGDDLRRDSVRNHYDDMGVTDENA